jgi:hypothetical protein
MFAIPAAERDALYAAAGRAASAVFPVTFAGQPGLAAGVVSGTLNGFYSRPGETVICSITMSGSERSR